MTAHLLEHLTIAIAVLGTAACRPQTPNAMLALPRAVDSTAVFSLPVAATGLLHWPTAAWFDDGWVIAGNVFPFGLNAQVGHRALYLAHSRTGLLPLPEGDFLFGYPLVRASRDGALHLFWSEGPQSPMPDGWPYTLTEIWDATFEHGRWTTPELVIRGKWLSWESTAPQLVTDDSGRFHLVVTAADTGRPEETYHLMRDVAGWHRQGTGEHGLYPALASFPGGGLIMILVLNDSNAPSSGLYAKWSSDYGRTWGRPVRVLDGAYTSAVYKTQLRVVGDSL